MQTQNNNHQNSQFNGPNQPGNVAQSSRKHRVTVQKQGGSVRIREVREVAETTLTCSSPEWSAFAHAVQDGLYEA